MKKNNKGFTLVEVLAVMVILGILALIAVPAIGGIIENSREDAFRSTAQNIVASAQLAFLADDSIFTDETNGSETVSATVLENNDFLEELSNDPWGDAYETDNTVVTRNTDGSYSIYVESAGHLLGTSTAPVAASAIESTNPTVAP